MQVQSYQLKPFQEEAVRSLHVHNHIVLTAATGSGKSLIFHEYLRLNPDTRALLITPLNALSRQHANNLQCKINPESGSGIWVVSPEHLKLNTRIKEWRPNFLIVDEAHSIWEWGDEFRPDFKFILKLVSEWNIQKSFWCTATLPYVARQELLSSLPQDTIQLGNFSVPKNLFLSAHKIPRAERAHLIMEYCKERENSLGIIFCATRPIADRMGERFKHAGFPAWVYHAGLSLEERTNLESQLKKATAGVILATSAFGMGMDIPQIRYCVLFQPPFTMLSLMQSLGRATRTERPAEGVVLWHYEDFQRFDWVIKDSAKRRDELEIVKNWCRSLENKRELLESYFNYAPDVAS